MNGFIWRICLSIDWETNDKIELICRINPFSLDVFLLSFLPLGLKQKLKFLFMNPNQHITLSSRLCPYNKKIWVNGLLSCMGHHHWVFRRHDSSCPNNIPLTLDDPRSRGCPLGCHAHDVPLEVIRDILSN